jgi:hypothetical protein
VADRRVLLLCSLTATLAAAHGLAPQSLGIAKSPWAPNGLLVSTTFGALVTDDRCTWEWICPEVLGLGAREVPTWTVTSSGTLYAAAFSGLFVSRDRGCSFERQPTFEGRGASAVVEADGTLFVTTGRFGARNGLFVSTDDGRSFASPNPSSDTLFFSGVRAVGDRRVVSAWYFEPRRLALFLSDDRGATFTEVDHTASFPGGSVFTVHAVDAASPQLVFASIVNDSVTPEQGTLLRSLDGGRTFTAVLTGPGRVSSMAQDGSRWWVALGERVFASDNGVDFTPQDLPKQRACVARVDGQTLVCGRQPGEDGFSVANVTQAVSPLLTWDRISGPRACPSGSPTSTTCGVSWPVERAELGLAVDHVAACGGEVPAPIAPPPTRGCHGAPGGAAVVLALLFFRARRGRVESLNRR